MYEDGSWKDIGCHGTCCIKHWNIQHDQAWFAIPSSSTFTSTGCSNRTVEGSCLEIEVPETVIEIALSNLRISTSSAV